MDFIQWALSIRGLKVKQTVGKEAEKRRLQSRCKHGRIMTIFTNSVSKKKQQLRGNTDFRLVCVVYRKPAEWSMEILVGGKDWS